MGAICCQVETTITPRNQSSSNSKDIGNLLKSLASKEDRWFMEDKEKLKAK